MDAILSQLQAVLDGAGEAVACLPVLRDPAALSAADLHAFLLQRRFVSLSFSALYDSIIDALDAEAARKVCRQILREEYPDEGGNRPSHREDLVSDLIALGIDKADVRRASPAPATLWSIRESFDLIRWAGGRQRGDVATLAIAAGYGESFVAAEYQALLSTIVQGLRGTASRFYVPHAEHDGEHAHRLLEQIASLIADDPDQLASFGIAVERCLRIKECFYRQFNTASGVKGQ